MSTQGLPANQITCLKQTRDGYLWVGTRFGLARFDGVGFTVFNKLNTPALPSDAVNALAEDETGTLWIGTSEGLVGYGERGFHRVPGGGVAETAVWRLANSRSGGLWVHAGGKVALFRQGRLSCARQVEWLGNQVRALSEGRDGGLHILMEHGWFQLSAGGEVLRTNYLVRPGEPRLLAAVRRRAGRFLGGKHGGDMAIGSRRRARVAARRAGAARGEFHLPGPGRKFMGRRQPRRALAWKRHELGGGGIGGGAVQECGRRSFPAAERPGELHGRGLGG